MLTIRLQRAGKRNKPEFRLVLAEKTASASKKFLEILGNYNPRTKDFSVRDENRLKYWISQQVILSPTVNNLLVSKNLITTSKVRAFSVPKKAEEKSEQKQEPAAQATDSPTAQAADQSAEGTTDTPPAETALAPEASEEKAEEKPADEPKAE